LKAHYPWFPEEVRPEPPTPWWFPGSSIQTPVTTIKAREPQVLLTIKNHKVNQHLSYSFLSGTQVLQENYCSGHIRPASRMLLHSAFSLLLGRFPFLSLLFNSPTNSYSSARARPSI
jgi:hypothetical protein